MGFNIDGGAPHNITVGAVGADRWEVEVFGKASHAGVHPERGISATIVAARALASIHEDGWFGKIVRDGKEGTSNVGPVGDAGGRSAGQATNVVTDYVKINGESRSRDVKFIGTITAAYRRGISTGRPTGRFVTISGQVRRKVKFKSSFSQLFSVSPQGYQQGRASRPGRRARSRLAASASPVERRPGLELARAPRHPGDHLRSGLQA